MSGDIEVGDKVTMGDQRTYVVLHIHTDWAWIAPDNLNNCGHLRRVEYLAKVRPVFEVGKTYRRRHTETRVEVVDKRGDLAIGWSFGTSGAAASWFGRDGARGTFTEVAS